MADRASEPASGSLVPADRPAPGLFRDRESGAVVRLAEPLTWRPVAPFSREFELGQGGRILGEMGPTSGEGVAAWGECFGDAWEIVASRRFWTSRVDVTLRRTGSREAGLAYEGWVLGRGTIITPSGERLRWHKPFLGHESHQVWSSDKVELLRLRPATWAWTLAGATRVLVSSVGSARDDLTQLILLSWFLRVQAAAVFRRPYPVTTAHGRPLRSRRLRNPLS